VIISPAQAPTPDDGELVAAALAGRVEAFGTLVERYDRAVYNLALRTMRDPEEAKDATQEAFFKAQSSPRGFSRSPITPVATDSRAANVIATRSFPNGPMRGPARSSRPNAATKRACCGKPSTPCRTNTGQ